jgi:O-antigen ligase
MLLRNVPLSYRVEMARVKLKSLAFPALLISTLVLAASSGLLASLLPLLPQRRVKLLAGLPIIFLALYSPHWIILLILTISSRLINARSLPTVARLTPVELGVILLLGLIVIRALSDPQEYPFIRTPLDWPVFLFVLAGLVSLFNAKYILGTYNFGSMTIWRILFDYLLFFAVTNLVRTRGQLMTLVGGMLVMATLVAALMIAQQVVGPARSVLPGSMNVWTARVFTQQFSGVARINIPGSAMVYVMLVPVLILHATPEYLKGRKWLSLIPVVLLPLAIAFTFSRNLWIGIILAIIIFVAVARVESKKLISLIAVLVVLATLLVPLASSYYARVNDITEALFFRANSLFAGDELLNDPSTQWRLEENELAIPKIKEHPILGLGPGAEYRKPTRQVGGLTSYIHNGYLYMLLDFGITGFLPFLWFSIIYLIRGFSSWYTLKEPVFRAIVIGFAVSYIAVLSSSTTSPRLLEANYATLLGVMLGINEVAIRLGERSAQ